MPASGSCSSTSLQSGDQIQPGNDHEVVEIGVLVIGHFDALLIFLVVAILEWKSEVPIMQAKARVVLYR